MGFVKEAKAESMAKDAARARAEGRRVFIVQIRGAFSHSPKMSRPIADVAEQIEAIEDQGWYLEQFTSMPYDSNMTTVCLFRRREARNDWGR